MTTKKTKLIVIVGPTASGKSALAVALAKKFNGEVISADSLQIYRGLDIGTGKITSRQMRGVPHHLIDIANPKRQMSAYTFASRAHAAIAEITKRRRIPIIVGGTGFWIDTLIRGITFPPVSPDPRLRKKLYKKSGGSLLLLLRRLDPARAATIEQKNPRRLIRAIEIARALGKIPAIKKEPRYRALWIGFAPARQDLELRIKTRITHWMRQGLIEEGMRLRSQGLSWKRFDALGFDYRHLGEYLRKTISKKDLIARLVRAHRAYAKKQMAWWRRNHSVHWITDARAAERAVRQWRSL